MAQLVGTSSHKPKSRRHDSQSGHVLGRKFGPPSGYTQEATDGYFSLTLMLLSLPSLLWGQWACPWVRITKQKPINKNTVTKRLSISETPNKIFTAEILSGTGSPNQANILVHMAIYTALRKPLSVLCHHPAQSLRHYKAQLFGQLTQDRT